MNADTRVLVVDDEPSTLKLLEYVLTKAGFEVHLATNGAEGLEAVERVLPHVVVADVVMPEVDGLEMCRRIRQMPGFELVPFVFLSARSQIQDRVEGLETGADDYIAKPFDREELLARIEAALRRAEAWHRAAGTDALTHLFTRGAFERRLEEELYRERRYGVSATVALVAIDLDELARIRAEAGSSGADALLRHVGEFLRDNVRSLDVPSRFSASGFMVLMPHTSRDRALVAIRRLNEALNRSQARAGDEAIPVRASFGVVVVDADVSDFSGVLNRAHESVMVARREGTGIHVWTPEDGS